jgi:selenocysteine lyase/cysteine desulfurase
LKDRVPTVSFRHKTKKPLEIATKLAADNIFVWNGHNYAFGIVTQLGIPIDEGVVRVGPTHYNTLEEVDRTVEVVRRVVGR